MFVSKIPNHLTFAAAKSDNGGVIVAMTSFGPIVYSEFGRIGKLENREEFEATVSRAVSKLQAKVH